VTSDPNKLKFSDLGFGFLNNCSDQGAGNSVDRRRSNGTDYLKAAIQKTYQPSAMSGVGNTMTGIVMHCSQKKPGAARTKEDILSAYARTGLQRAWDKVKSWTSDGLINVYKVYIPEIECRPAPLSFEDPVVFTYYDVYQATGLDAKDPIPLGSVVHVEFENLVNFKNPTIVWCSEEPVAFEGEGGASAPGGGGGGSAPARNGGKTAPAPVGGWAKDANDPGNCPWSNHKRQRTDTWQSSDPRYSKWNGTVISNGSLEDTGMLATDSASGVQALPPVMEDFLKLADAYKVKFGKQLKGSGYRTYASQVSVRMKRAGPGHNCGQGSERLGATGRKIGKAATPGTSNHGWGAAIDLVRSDWTKGRGNRSPEFRWLNKFSADYNFVFNVTNEHWHITWKNIKSVLPGMNAPGRPWNSSGLTDASIDLTTPHVYT